MKRKQSTKRLQKPITHPWDRWFRRKRFELQRGRDYHCQPHSMAIQIRNMASRMGLRFSIQTIEGLLIVTRQPRRRRKKR